MKEVFIVINEQHTILENQKEQIEKSFPDSEWQYIKLPAEGLNLLEIKNKVQELMKKEKGAPIIFISPVPAMMSLLNSFGRHFFVFHNDKRDKKELPDGRIIFTVSQIGWQIV